MASRSRPSPSSSNKLKNETRRARQAEGQDNGELLLIAEHDNASLSDQTTKALTAAARSVATSTCWSPARSAKATAEAARPSGVRKVLPGRGRRAGPTACRAAGRSHRVAWPVAMMRSSRLPPPRTSCRVRLFFDVMQVSEIVEVVSPDTFKRPIYAGNAIQTVQSTDAKKVITVRTAASRRREGGSALVETVAAAANHRPVELRREQALRLERPELTSARIIISGSRAFLGSSEKFQEIILPVADKLGAAVSAARAAVDAGYAPAVATGRSTQTGKVVAPGLLHRRRHLRRDPAPGRHEGFQVIVAINKDEEAPIFQVADYGIVGDLFTVLPELEKAL